MADLQPKTPEQQVQKTGEITTVKMADLQPKTPEQQVKKTGKITPVVSDKEEYRVMVIGKSGNGKSTLCNSILGEEKFPTGRGISTKTNQSQVATINHQPSGKDIKVVDTPDLCNPAKTPPEMNDEIQQWEFHTRPFPSAVLLAVRCDVRYTPEEYGIYRQIRQAWKDKSLIRRLIVAFTFGDKQDKDIEEELKTAPQELKKVLKAASGRYVLFNSKASPDDKARQVGNLIAIIQQMEKDKRGQKPGCFACLSSRPSRYEGVMV